MAEDSGIDASCPQCGEPISGREGQCPACGLDFLDDEGGLSQDAVDAMLEDAGIEGPDVLPSGQTYTPGWVRLLVGLSITVPMGPLTMFVVESAAPAPLWVGVLAFLVGWLLPGYVISRQTVPSAIVGTGLLVVGATLAVTPLAIVVGRTVLGTEPGDIGALGSNVMAVQAVFLLFGVIVLGLGVIVYRHARAKRTAWAEQAADARE